MYEHPEPPLHQTVVDIEKVRADFLYVAPDGRTFQRGKSLATWRERIGGDVGVLKDPWGRPHEISLTSYADDDRETTFLQIAFKYPPADQWETETR